MKDGKKMKLRTLTDYDVSSLGECEMDSFIR